MDTIVWTFASLRPGDRLVSRLDIPRWIGSYNWYGGLFVTTGEEIIVTDVYPSGCRVVHPIGGIHFIINRQHLIKQVRFVRHGLRPPHAIARDSLPDTSRGSWPRYQGEYRVSLRKEPTTKGSTPKNNFAIVAKRGKKTVGKDRQTTKPKTRNGY